MRYTIPVDDEREEYGDDLLYGEIWTWKELENVEFWSIVLALLTNNFAFNMKYKNCQATLPVTLTKTVTVLTAGPRDLLLVSAKTTDPNQEQEYIFFYLIPSRNIVFSIATTAVSLEDSSFRGLHKSIYEHIKQKRWVTSSGLVLPPKVLATRMNAVMNSFNNDVRNMLDKEKAKDAQGTRRETSEQARGDSFAIVELATTGRSKTKRKNTLREGRKQLEAAPTSA